MKTTKITENFLPKQAIGKLLVTCQFTTKYRDYESKAEDYNCDNKDDVLDSGLCKFHDENHLQDKNKHNEREHEVVTKLMVKVNKSKDRKEALLCIGYHLPDNITIKGKLTKPVYFLQAKKSSRCSWLFTRFTYCSRTQIDASGQG